VGDPVVAGQPLLELHAEDAARIPAALEALDGAFEITDAPTERAPLVLDRIT
jgi:thymidine phosphorylase